MIALLAGYTALAALSLVLGARFAPVFGGVFQAWWVQALVALPALLALAGWVARWRWPERAWLFLAASTAFWSFATAGYLAQRVDGIRLDALAHVAGIAGAAVVLASLRYALLSWRRTSS